VDNPDHLIVHELYGPCPCGCGSDLRNQPVLRYERRQVVELPPQKAVVTEHRTEVKRCPKSGREISASFPEDMGQAPIQYGHRFMGLLVYLRDQQLMPLKRISQLSADLFGRPVSEATIEAALTHVYDELSEFEAQVSDLIAQSPIAHADETGLRVEGKLHWLHLASTPRLTWYGVHEKRGGEAIRHFNLLPRFAGRLIHDCWSPYFKLECDHGLCNAHLLRELKFLHEVCRQKWAKPMADLLVDMHRSVDAAATEGTALTTIECAAWTEAYRTVLREGFAENPEPPSPPGSKRRGRPKHTKAQNLLARLQEHEGYILAFLHDPQVPFTNNQAEQDVRMMKVQQKISGGFRTLAGAQIFARIRGYVSTVRKNGRNVLEDIVAALQGQPFIPARGP
jgi:transposase